MPSEATQFKPGQSGNPAGRPKGARNKLDKRFVKALYEDFKEHGVEALEKVRESNPDKYLTVITKVLPKVKEVSGEVNVNHGHYVISAQPKALDVTEWEAKHLESSGVRSLGHKPR